MEHFAPFTPEMRLEWWVQMGPNGSTWVRWPGFGGWLDGGGSFGGGGVQGVQGVHSRCRSWSAQEAGRYAKVSRCRCFFGCIFFDGSLSGCWGQGTGGSWLVEDGHLTTIEERLRRGK